MADEDLGDVVGDEGGGVGLVVGDDDVETPGPQAGLPDRFIDEGHVLGNGPVLGVPGACEGGIAVLADREVEPGLGHEPQVGLVEVEGEDARPGHA